MEPSAFVPARLKENYHMKTMKNKVAKRHERRHLGLTNDDFISDVADPEILTINSGGKRMKLKYKERESIKVGQGPKKYPMIQVKGTVVGGPKDGDERIIKFFPSEKDMHETVKNANAGDILDVTMKQNGNFWNPVAIHNDTQDGANSSESFNPSLYDMQKGNTPTVPAQPTGNFSREETVRAAAVEQVTSLGAYKDVTILDINSMLYDADQIAEYILKGLPESDIDLPEVNYDEGNGDD